MEPLMLASAGLDVVSGVMGYIDSFNKASIANSRADMIRNEAEANAQRYAEKAQADIAHQKVMYLASGVTLAGSPLDVLDNHARIARENIAAIRMGGTIAAFDEEQKGQQALEQGRNALIGGLLGGGKSFAMSSFMGGKTSTGLGGPAADSAGSSSFDASGVA